MLEIKNLNKQFKKKVVLNDISLKMDKKIYGLLGANGAGKTTLIRCITGLYDFNSGNVLWNNKGIKDAKDYYEKMGYLPQKFDVLREMKVKEALKFFADLRNVEVKQIDSRVNHVLELVNLSEAKENKMKTLSGGMIRRVGIAQAFINNPDILFFDEPTAGLDPEERLRFKNIIMNNCKDKTVLISTHIIEDLEAVCDEIIVMHKGKIIDVLTVDELAMKAKGKVYEVEKESIRKLKGKYTVIKEYYKNGNMIIRVLADEKQGFDPIVPTAEDGYLCLTHLEL